MASSLNAAASSLSVSNVPGAPPIKEVISESVYDFALTNAASALDVASALAVEIASASAVSAYACRDVV